ncbi:hypothetical protein TCAL_02545 [Tigriopus californicus]|uniref:Attacin C-terminal domain-containing protein n=1 Tax=Tigriopus californicus TaxID=6832 RepID=A0A553P6H9_TIGCA|nr:uncharacterized protein LOC131877804 [Tigriopus californicus]TRY73230.1 hypothetical protein TCAL_02545 [Tigriopus californicus]|eukprot:TCALIF_02545-PA protein Name:"Protein of unknown function" AED:0.00 eAED:0.00 QI:264/1/1/1/1/1/2/160/200
MEAFRFFYICAMVVLAHAAPAPQFDLSGLFGGGQPQQQQQQQQFNNQNNGQFQNNQVQQQQQGGPLGNLNLGHAVGAAGFLGAGLLTAKNIKEDNTRLSLRPQVGLAFNTQTQRLEPNLGVGVQVGEGNVAPTFNLGGQFSGGKINPFVTGGVSTFNDKGQINPGINSGFTFNNGQAQGVVGGNVNVGKFDVGRLPFSGR